MAHQRLVVLFMIMLIIATMIEQNNGIYLDCQARCLLKNREERTREKLQVCRDECEILELLEQEDARDGKHYRYRLFK